MTAEPMTPAWQEGAACVGTGDLMFPASYYWAGRTGNRENDEVASAKAVCRQCPVARECLLYALETEQEHGVWGGLTPRQRSALSRRRDP